MKCILFCSLFIFVVKSSFAQYTKKNDSFKLYEAGYKSIITKDSSRIYDSRTGPTDKLHFRPLEIDLWYPAVNSKPNQLIRYGEFIGLLEERSNRFQQDTVYNNLAAELVQYICSNLNIRDTAKLTHLNTFSYRNAGEAGGKFPLIIYMCSYNGMCYENLNLFECLASHGYTIACITSVGKYPGNMSTNPPDLMEQVYDGAFAMNYLKTANNVDSTRIGIMGYSWGGLAALTLAMNAGDTKAILSLDGSEMHYYGESKEEDDDFDLERNLAFHQLSGLNIPYTYLESGFKQAERKPDSIFNILNSLNSQKQYIHFTKATHEDFSCLPSLITQIAEKKDRSPQSYGQINQFALNFFDKWLKNKDDGLASQLSAIFRQQIADSVYPVMNKMETKSDLIIEGRIADQKDNVPLAYVNVGIPGKNIGTVTQKDGRFILHANQELRKDSIKISMVGYQSQTFAIEHLLRKNNNRILLTEKIADLKAVTVTARALRTKRMGNTTTSRFVSVGLPLKFLGSETGIKISLGKKRVLLKSFHFTISDNRLDTSVFRLNIYNFKNGLPFENILHQNILVSIGKQTGTFTVNLSDYKLLMKNDILVSLEWIEGASSPKGTAVFLSAGFLNSATWHRLTSQGEWKKFNGMGVGFNMDVQRLSN